MCGLQELVLTHNALNDSGLRSLASVLPLLPGLKGLRLGFNLLGIEGIFPLMRAVSSEIDRQID